ncbi:hypothetical protein D477_018721 [Arthrobacter crystallopoietes BAB-32]|uniref:DUF2795 domain-containing protein n=1 Tax=Arthrobacter crystallopoietes BAB-32 TaxID=1246476 RepID=N1UUH8_9MICC|nr:DUF2795 domain-containing protein [Arthrobacter crystallopoietes]EMY32695.1 hypothetical protein D477_018721 [Arthrobacter crystallopoietes BAB-32]
MADPSPIDIQKALGGVDYPASAADLVKKAEDSGADSGVLDALRSLPDRQYENPAEVNKAISGN